MEIQPFSTFVPDNKPILEAPISKADTLSVESAESDYIFDL